MPKQILVGGNLRYVDGTFVMTSRESYLQL